MEKMIKMLQTLATKEDPHQHTVISEIIWALNSRHNVPQGLILHGIVWSATNLHPTLYLYCGSMETSDDS